MTTLARLVLILIITLFFSSCTFDINFGNGKKGNGNLVTESREISDDFTVVSVSEGIVVYVTQADDFDIEVEADENIIDLIGTDIKNGKLRIHAIENIGRSTKKVFVTLPKINGLKGSSGANLKTEGLVSTNELEVDGSSGATLNIQVDVNKIDIDASSGANLTLSGEADKAVVDVSSGGNINAKQLDTESCNADASSGGNVSISVSEFLTADASSGGNIRYSGDADVEKKKSVSGSVHKY